MTVAAPSSTPAERQPSTIAPAMLPQPISQVGAGSAVTLGFAVRVDERGGDRLAAHGHAQEPRARLRVRVRVDEDVTDRDGERAEVHIRPSDAAQVVDRAVTENGLRAGACPQDPLVDTEDQQELAATFNIRSIPNVIALPARGSTVNGFDYGASIPEWAYVVGGPEGTTAATSATSSRSRRRPPAGRRASPARKGPWARRSPCRGPVSSRRPAW